MKTIALLTPTADLQRLLTQAVGQRVSIVLLTPPNEPVREKFDAVFATWSRLADALIVDVAALGETGRWAIESLTALDHPSIAVRVSATQRRMFDLPDRWLVFSDTDAVEQVEQLLRNFLDLRAAQAGLRRMEAAPRRPPALAATSAVHSHRYGEALKNLSHTLGRGLPREALQKDFLRLVRELFSVGRVALFARDGETLTLAASTGVNKEFADHVRLTVDAGLGGALVSEGNILRRGQVAEAREFELLGTEVAVPMFDDDQLVGVLTCGNKITGEALTSEELELLYHLLAHLAQAIHNRELQTQIESQQRFLRDVLMNLQTGVVIISEDNRILEINQRARELLELGEQTLVGQPAGRLPSIVGDVLYEVLASGKTAQGREVVLHPSRRPLGVNASRVQTSAATTVVALVEDLTQIKARQVAARELEEREFFTRVSYRLSHELKNSLVSIKIFGQLLPERYNEKDFREQFSGVVVNEVNRVDVLVNNLTFFAQPLGLVYEDLTLNEVVDACVKNLTQEFARKKIAQLVPAGEKAPEATGLAVVNVKRTFGHKTPRMAGDRIRLTQAMEHVMRNAAQSMPQGGRLTISTADATADDYLTGKLPPGGAVKIEFVDSGEGIALEHLSRVTEPFVTTRNVGVGLGLTIVKKIIDRHSGRLELDSMLGRGTTVRFLLPVVMQPHPEDNLLAQLAKSRSASEYFSGETEDAEQNRLAQVMEANRRRRSEKH